MAHWEKRHKLVPAVYVLLERGGKLLLIRRYNTGYSDGKYSLPAGHMDGDEPPSVAAAREALEEVGVVVSPVDLQMVHCMIYKAIEGDHERVSLFFKAKKFDGEPVNKEPHKCDDVQWFPADNMPENIVWELRHALEQVANGNVYSETNY
jgi:8-oxo-dGTP pyrophosphatase MutT (NUDIX family)